MRRNRIDFGIYWVSHYNGKEQRKLHFASKSEGRKVKRRQNTPAKQYEVLNSDPLGKLKCQSKAYSTTRTGRNLTNLQQVGKRQSRICCIHQPYVTRWHLDICLAQVVFQAVCENRAQERHECAPYELAGFQR